MSRENSKCRKWEKQRRNRLSEAFSALAKVLPCYDPCVNICKIDILTIAQATIKEQQDELNKILSTKGDNKNIRGDVLKRLQERILRLLLRNEQLRDLLTAAGITIPKSVRKISVRDNRFKKASPEEAKIFQKKEMEKENKLAHTKKKKVKFTSAPVTLKRQKIDSNKLPPKKRKTDKTSAATPCLFVLPQPSITAGINNSYYLLSNQQVSPRKSMPSAIAISSTFPFVNPPLLSAEPGTFVLANGTMLPIIPNQRVLISNQQLISKNIKSIITNSVNVSKSNRGTIEKCEKKSLPQVNKIRPIKPKCCTNTTQINKVPIPALTSRYANNQSLLRKECLIAENVKCQSKKGRNISNGTRTKVINRKTETSIKVDVEESKEDKRCDNESQKNAIINESEKKSVEGKSMNIKSSLANIPQSSILTTTETTTSTDVVSSSLSNTMSNREDENCNTSSSKNTHILDNKEANSEKMTCNNGQVTEGNESKKPATENMDISHSNENVSCLTSSADIVAPESMEISHSSENLTCLARSDEISASENMDISHSVENLTCLVSSTACDDNIKHLGLNLVHSELSNDIFASLHVPPGCQNPESTSPTAAFLMAFPLVSSVKATDVIDDDHSSQRQTPTLLQIGTMDSTKQTHTDTLTGSLLNLESFSFFNSKDVCENYYESCTNNLSKGDNQLNSSDIKSKVECANVNSSSIATICETNSIESVLSNVDHPKNDTKNSQNVHYSVFPNTAENQKSVHQFDLSEKVPYGEYTNGKSSTNTADDKRIDNEANKSTVQNIDENSCTSYPAIAKVPSSNTENVETLVTTENTSKKTDQVYSESIKSINHEKNKSCHQDIKMKETQEYMTCQENELKKLSHVPINFPPCDSDKDILETIPYNMFQEKSRQNVTGLNDKLSSDNKEILCNYRQQIKNPCINASTNDIHHATMYNEKAVASNEIVKKANVNYKLHQNIVPGDNMYKSFHSNITENISNKTNTEDNTNATPYIYPMTDLKSSNNQCKAQNTNSANMLSVTMEKGSNHLYSVDNISFNNFHMRSIQKTEVEKSSNKLTENIAFNIFEITHPSKPISSSENRNNPNTGENLSHTVHHQSKKDVSQKNTVDKSQCYYSTTYPDSSYNISYKNDGSKLYPTCSYMNLNKSYSNPLYTNSTNYNYHSDCNINQNYYKTSTPKTDSKSYYSLNYENYQEYKKSEGHHFPKCPGNGSIQRNKRIVDKTNAAEEKCIPQNKLVNWMTTPENKSLPSDAFITFPNQSYSFMSCVSGETGDISNILEPKKQLDISLLSEEKQFSWSQSKLPNFLDQTHSFITPTLPTLVGDLALGNPISFNDQKMEYKYPKDQKRKNNACENQTNFFSVSQLVDHNKTETVPSRIISRRSSGGRSNNTAQMKNKRPSKIDSNDKVSQSKPTNIFNSHNSDGVFSEHKSVSLGKNTSSSYSAEALIGNQVSGSSKKYPSNASKLMGSSGYHSENITNFSNIEENYVNQNQNFQSSVYTNNSFQTTNKSTISTNTFIHTTPTISSTYLSSNFEAPCYEYPDNLNVVAGSAVREKVSNVKSYKQAMHSKDDKNINYTNSFAKKTKKKIGNETINSGFSNFEFPLLPIPGSTNSPILPDDFHTHTSFLPPTAPFSAKTSMYQKQGNDFTPSGLLPPPALSRNTTQLPDVPPLLNSVGTSLTNFNLSTIFPEINKGNVSNVYQDDRTKEHSISLQDALVFQ